MDDYLQRFFNSAAVMRLQPAFTKEDLTSNIYELLHKNKLDESGVKVILTGGYSPESYDPATPNLIITQQKLQTPANDKFSNGIKVITYEYQRDLPGIKSINYLMGVWLQQIIKENGAEDVLYFKEGFVTEFSRSNVFLVTSDKKLVTPSDNILHGITRKKLLELAVKNYTVECRAVTITELKEAAEVFMTSTTKRLLPVTRIDNTVIGNGSAGPVTALLNTAFIKMEEEVLSGRVMAGMNNG
ncbi:MAG: aminotransferase class IV [Ferruginibacter sp.]